MLKYVRMTEHNIDEIVKAQMEIFPSECGYFQYNYAITCNKDYWKYWLVYDNDNNIVGITGLYSDFNIEKTYSIWLGWFGIRPIYRRKGYGKEVLEFTIKEAYKLASIYPIKYLRLYTSIDENKEAQILYKKIMDYKEPYNCKEDKNYNGTCYIWTKSLFGDKITKWDNKYLGLKEIEEKEKEYQEIFLNKGVYDE